MWVWFRLHSECDFKEKQLVDGSVDGEFGVTNEETGETFQGSVSFRLGDELDGLTNRLRNLFGIAYKEFGFRQKIHSWDDKPYYPTWHGEKFTDKAGKTIGEVEWWKVSKLPRKRRWGTMELRGTCVWDGDIGMTPTEFFNPVGNALENRAHDTFCDCGTYNCFNKHHRSYTARRIRDGLEATRRSVEFYEKMARLYEQRVGHTVYDEEE